MTLTCRICGCEKKPVPGTIIGATCLCARCKPTPIVALPRSETCDCVGNEDNVAGGWCGYCGRLVKDDS